MCKFRLKRARGNSLPLIYKKNEQVIRGYPGKKL